MSDYYPSPLRLPEALQWQKDLTFFESTNNLACLQMDDPDEFDYFLVPLLGIEHAAPIIKADYEATESEEEEAERSEELKRKIINRRGAMRGLSMELLMGSSLRHFDTPAEVIANVKLSGDQPSIAAQGGMADIVANYPSAGFRIHAEVSAKQEMDVKTFKTQLESAWKHAYSVIQKEIPVRRVYCLLVNNGKIYRDKKLHNPYLDFIQKKSLVSEDRIRMVPMYTPDFVMISGCIMADIPDEKMYFKPKVLSAALNAVYSQVIQYDLPEERTWMVDIFMEEVERLVG